MGYCNSDGRKRLCTCQPGFDDKYCRTGEEKFLDNSFEILSFASVLLGLGSVQF